MIKSYRSKKTVEACQWLGSNRLELEDFVGKENIEFVIFSNKDPVPTVFTSTGEKEVKLKNYVIKDYDFIDVLTEYELKENYGND